MHGQIADVETGKPVPGVVITFIDNVSSSVARSTTGSSGEFAIDLQASPLGSTYRVVGEHPDYATRNDSVAIRPGDEVVEFNLYPKQKN
ncbi:MAG: carboxypeptidase-like regulatory domain-containing protein [Candidatus Sulfotelmatobacter sp.]